MTTSNKKRPWVLPCTVIMGAVLVVFFVSDKEADSTTNNTLEQSQAPKSYENSRMNPSSLKKQHTRAMPRGRKGKEQAVPNRKVDPVSSEFATAFDMIEPDQAKKPEDHQKAEGIVSVSPQEHIHGVPRRADTIAPAHDLDNQDAFKANKSFQKQFRHLSVSEQRAKWHEEKGKFTINEPPDPFSGGADPNAGDYGTNVADFDEAEAERLRKLEDSHGTIPEAISTPTPTDEGLERETPQRQHKHHQPVGSNSEAEWYLRPPTRR